MKQAKHVFTVGLILFTSFHGISQESLISAGGSAISADANICYSIGQVMFSSHASPDAVIEDGVQHAYGNGLSPSISFRESQTSSLGISTFPNPTINELNIHLDNYLDQQLTYKLYDTKGNIVFSNNISAATTSIDMTNLRATNYFLHIIEQGRDLQTFIIQKSN